MNTEDVIYIYIWVDIYTNIQWNISAINNEILPFATMQMDLEYYA